jgi:hypothetical protein
MGSMDDRTDFGDRQPLPGHLAVRVDVPDNLPEKFRRPAQYILTAVRESHEVIHAFCHERCVVLIVSDQDRATRIRQFAADLLTNMARTTRIFRLRAEGVASLSKPLVAELVSRLGEIVEIKMNSSRDDYADTASVVVRQNIDWQCPETLPFRAYGLNLQAKLVVTDAKRPDQAHRVQRQEAKNNAPARDDASWQVVRRPKVTKVDCCRDFARGTCTRGDKCVFRHAKEACRDAARGRCTRQNCKFEHEPKPDALDLALSAPDGGSAQHSGNVAPSAAASGATCLDFMRGRCVREQCKFAHATSGAAQTQAASAPPVRSRNRPGPAQHSPKPHDGIPPSSSSSPHSSPVASPVASPSSASRSSRSSSSSSSSPASSSAPASPKPARRSSRFDLLDSPPGSPDNSPRPARSRSRSWSANEMPHPGSPRNFWQKPPTLGLSAMPKSVLGKKRPLTQASSPASTSLLAEQEPQQQHAAPSEGADRQAP